MPEMLKIRTRGGDTVDVDISDEACSPFGVKHGDRIIDPNNDHGVVMGVAPGCGTINRLWYILDEDSPLASYYGTPKKGHLRPED